MAVLSFNFFFLQQVMFLCACAFFMRPLIFLRNFACFLCVKRKQHKQTNEIAFVDSLHYNEEYGVKLWESDASQITGIDVRLCFF